MTNFLKKIRLKYTLCHNPEEKIINGEKSGLGAFNLF